MRTPCEWTLNDFVPKIRREVVKNLYEMGYNQKEIAKTLGISQPRISQYLSVEKNTKRKMSSEQVQLIDVQMNQIVTRTVNDIIVALKEGKKTAETIPIICYSCRELRMGNALCTLHRYDYPEINSVFSQEKNCDLCLRWKVSPQNSKESVESLGSRFTILRDLENGANLLIMKPTFYDYIPQIGAQLCLIFEGVQGENDSLENIAGFPGRIIQLQGRAKIVSRPEFNSSKTTGTLLLDVRKINVNIKVILSIKNQDDKNFENTLEKKEFSIIRSDELDKHGLSNKVSSEFLNKSKIALIDTGSIGFEPITYIMAQNIADIINIFD